MNNRQSRDGRQNRGSSNDFPEPGRRHTTGGNMGAGRSGKKSFGSEKPEHSDNKGTKQPDDEL
jgi:hypothetical protein